MIEMKKDSTGSRYYLDGKPHREDGPAFEWSDGTYEWYLNGVLHRLDGPAVKFPNGDEAWVVNGRLHREDGPAVISTIDNYKIDFNLKSTDIPRRAKSWWCQGRLHRDGLPAVEYVDGSKKWYSHGELHRLDGPAIIRGAGGEAWYQNGKLHRLDGPASVEQDGSSSWWMNGHLHRLDGPAVVGPIRKGQKGRFWAYGVMLKVKNHKEFQEEVKKTEATLKNEERLRHYEKITKRNLKYQETSTKKLMASLQEALRAGCDPEVLKDTITSILDTATIGKVMECD